MDAKNLSQHLETNDSDSAAVNEVVNQIAFADLIVINKLDLVGRAQLETVEAEVRAINATAEVVHAQLTGDDSAAWMDKARSGLKRWRGMVGVTG